MSRRAILNSLVALVAILVAGGLAAAAVIRPPADLPDRVPVASLGGFDTKVDEWDTVGARPTTLAATTAASPSPTPAPSAVTLPPMTTVPSGDAQAPPATTPAPAPTAVAPVPVAPVATAPQHSALGNCLPAPICFERRPAPAEPLTWTGTGDGITVTARIEPAAPQLGDTVTIFYTATSVDGPCCWVSIGSTTEPGILPPPMPVTGCPPMTPSGSATVVMQMPAYYEFTVTATTGHFCQGPPDHPFPRATVVGTFWVNPLP